MYVCHSKMHAESRELTSLFREGGQDRRKCSENEPRTENEPLKKKNK